MIRIPVADLSKTSLEARYAERACAYAQLLDASRRRVELLLQEKSVRATVKARLKSFESLFDKVIRKARQDTSAGEVLVADLLGIRIVCPFLEDARTAEELVRSAFTVVERERKGDDYSPREFGYEATHLHVLVETPADLRESVQNEVLAEIQIRTLMQDAWAEIEHELMYKSEMTPFDEPLRRKLAAVNANLSLTDIIFQEIRDYQRRFKAELRTRRGRFHEKIKAAGRAAEGQAQPDPAGTPDAGFSDSVDNRLLAALGLHNKGDFPGAIELYTQLMQSVNKERVLAVILVHRGMAYFGDSRYETALADFSRALELDPRNARIHYYQGVMHRFTGEFSKALDDFERALELDPFHFNSLLSRAQVYFQLGDLVRARLDCMRAVKIRPAVDEAQHFLKLITRRMQA